MAKVAFMTVGLLHASNWDARVHGFIKRIQANNDAAEASDGFIDRSVRDEITREHKWGQQPLPTPFTGMDHQDRLPQTLSLWQDLESVFAFAYHGVHAEALSKRKEWFVKPEWPTYVAWWVEDGHTPTWEEAGQRYEILYQVGPTPEAFNFKQPFGSDGQPFKIDRQKVKKKVALNIGSPDR